MLYTGSTGYNDVWRSNDLGVTWVLSTVQASWAARSYMSAVYTGGTIVLMGGWGEDICGYILMCIHVYTYYIRMYTCVYYMHTTLTFPSSSLPPSLPLCFSPEYIHTSICMYIYIYIYYMHIDRYN